MRSTTHRDRPLQRVTNIWTTGPIRSVRKRKSEWSSNWPNPFQCPFMIMWPMGWWCNCQDSVPGRNGWPLWNVLHPLGQNQDRLHDSAIGLSETVSSGSVAQRVLATNPKIILLDEPTSALDPISAGKIEESLVWTKDRYTMLLLTRSMQQTGRISDKTTFSWMGFWSSTMIPMKWFLRPS